MYKRIDKETESGRIKERDREEVILTRSLLTGTGIISLVCRVKRSLSNPNMENRAVYNSIWKKS